MARRRRRRGGWYDFHDFPPPSRPREAKGGIRSRSRRGAFGESWWARRWVKAIESFHVGARLSRGRTYARKGQVTDVLIGDGFVGACVQGSRVEPYIVAIGLHPLDVEEWARVTGALGRQATFAAKLLAGEMPPEIEDVFRNEGLSLFPSRHDDLLTDCSCPDWSNPCKHIAAVFYLVAEELDRDPFLLFRLRGLEREDLIARLGGETPALEPGPSETAGEPEPLPEHPAAFWGAPPPPEDPAAGIAEIGGIASLPRRLGSFPFWRGREPFLNAMERRYGPAARVGLDILAGES